MDIPTITVTFVVLAFLAIPVTLFVILSVQVILERRHQAAIAHGNRVARDLLIRVRRNRQNDRAEEKRYA